MVGCHLRSVKSLDMLKAVVGIRDIFGVDQDPNPDPQIGTSD
jgi:hypothetical protein